jgi:hypothetical protein
LSLVAVAMPIALIAVTMRPIGAVTVDAASGPAGSASPNIQYCTPYEEYVPSGWSDSNASQDHIVDSQEYTYYNNNPIYENIPFQIQSGTTVSGSVTISASVQVDASVIVAGTKVTTGISVEASASQTYSTTLTGYAYTPPHEYAHFYRVVWGVYSYGKLYQVYSNCTDSQVGTIYGTVVPHSPADTGIYEWVNSVD